MKETRYKFWISRFTEKWNLINKWKIEPGGNREDGIRVGCFDVQNVVVVEEFLADFVNDETAENLHPHPLLLLLRKLYRCCCSRFSLFNASFRLMAEETKSDAVLTNAVAMTSVCLVTKQTDRRRMTLLKLFYETIICALIFQVRQLRITFHIFINCLFIEGLFSTCVPKI